MMKYSARARTRVIVVGVPLVCLLVAGAVLVLPRLVCDPSTDTPDQKKALLSLPYVNWFKPTKANRGKKGVTVHEPDQIQLGVTLVVHDGHQEVWLVNPKGKVVHRWKADKAVFDHATLMPTGDLLGIDEGKGKVFKLDWNSKELWHTNLDAHHDVTVAENGDLYVLTWVTEVIPELDPKRPLEDNHLAILTSEGKLKKQISFTNLLTSSADSMAAAKRLLPKLKASHRDGLDLFHANTLTVIDRDVTVGGKKLFSKGQVMTCVRNLDRVWVIDLEQEKIVWSWGGGELDKPHTPRLLANDRVLVFDNRPLSERSRVVEYDLASKDIVWHYQKATENEAFFSILGGNSERLPNGNTLITETTRCRVFEVTRDKRVVWEYFSPVIDGDKGCMSIYRASRIHQPEYVDTINRLLEQPKGK